MDILGTVTQKVGPLPVWAYGVIVGGAAGIYVFYIRKNKDAESGDESGETDDSEVDPVESSDGLLYSAPYGVGSATGAAPTDTNELFSINPQTGRPYIIDLSDPLNPETGNPYDVDYGNLVTTQQGFESRVSDLGGQITTLQERLNQQATAAPPLPAQIEAPAAPVQAAAPAPQNVPVNAKWHKFGPWKGSSGEKTRDSAESKHKSQGHPTRPFRENRKDGPWYGFEAYF